MEPRAGDPKTPLLITCHENLVRAFEWAARIVPGGVVEQVSGLTAVRTGMPDPSFNVLFGLDRPASLTEVRECIDRLFIRTQTQFEIITINETLDYLKPLVDEKGLTIRTDIPGMVLDPLPDSCPDPPKQFEIRTVREPKEMNDYLRTATAGFGAPPGFFDVWAAGLVAGAADPSFLGANYLGYAEGKPAATSFRYTTRHLAGIYLVSTLPEFRRRGFGAAMTWRASMDGRKEGCSASYLQASPMGRPVYERMGYRFVEEYQHWKAGAQPDR